MTRISTIIFMIAGLSEMIKKNYTMNDPKFNNISRKQSHFKLLNPNSVILILQIHQNTSHIFISFYKIFILWQ